jgi:hypothetical protein
MDELARLAPYLPQHEILDAWDDSYAKLWVRLSPMVREERDRTHWNRKWAAFETLGLEAAKKLLREGRTEGTVS